MSTYYIHSHYSCNGSPKGCERERFGHCEYHDKLESLPPSVQREWVAIRKRVPHKYSVTLELDGEIATHTTIAFGVAEAAEHINGRFENPPRILSIVDLG